MILFAKLPFTVSIAALQSEVALLTENWHPHFNTRHYEGDWSALSLRSEGGKADQIIPDALHTNSYLNTPLMQRCPSVTSFLSQLRCSIMSVRLLNLKKGSVIKEHRDHGLSFENGEARLHIPVFTNPQVEFYLDGNRLEMKEGECWYINANRPHRVANFGPADRIHLVTDCVVNDWLKEVFDESEKVLVDEKQNTAQTLQVIQQLRLQNTETSNRIADDLDKTLKDV